MRILVKIIEYYVLANYYPWKKFEFLLNEQRILFYKNVKQMFFFKVFLF